jgi:hypothetical protein
MYNETLTVPLSCGETCTLLALFIFSIKIFKMYALILGHSAYYLNKDTTFFNN